MDIVIPKFLTEDLAEKVTNMVLNTTIFDRDHTDDFKRLPFGHLVIIVPSMEDDRATNYEKWPNYEMFPRVLYEHSVGDQNKWERDFKSIAQCKALQLWHGRNGGGQTDSNAHLLFPGDTPYWGGVYRHGLCVAFSGQRPWFDQMISGMVADGLKAFAREALESSDDKEKGRDFLL